MLISTSQPKGAIQQTHLLEATASAANALLTVDNLDQAVNMALQIIGETLDTDRVCVIENFQRPSELFPGWKILYEWHSRHTVSQIYHPQVAQGTYKGITDWYDRINQGQALSYLLEEMPEPFRSGQAAIGVKALHIVPIFIDGKCWGSVGFDDCREAKRRSTDELAVLKTAAACIGSAIQRQRIQETLLQAEKERAAELIRINEALQHRDRLLSAVAQVTKNLLETEDIDVAVPTALQAIGEVANMSRVQLILEFADQATKKLHHRITYEWVAPGIVPQINHPTMAVIDNDHAEVIVKELYAGRSIWRIIDDLPDVIRWQFESIGIKSTGGVPLFIEGRYIGAVTFDDCIQYRQWSQQEIDVLTTAAEGIGAALHRKQLVEAKQAAVASEQEKASQRQLTELARANESLRICVNRLADQLDSEKFLEHILLEASAQIGSYAAALFLYEDSSHNTRVMKGYVREGEVVPIKKNPEMAMFQVPISGNTCTFWETSLLRGEAVVFNLDDCDEQVYPQINWHRTQGHRSIVRVPLILGSRPLGFIGLCFREYRASLPQNIELIMTLAQQATLAIHLTKLAENSRHAAILEERNRMAREIHDTLAQAFTGVIVQLGAASRIVTDDLIEVQTHITQARDLAREGLAEARRSLNALRPQILETGNLSKAFNRLVSQMSTSIDTQIVCRIVGQVYSLSVDIENNLLRIGQEALTNAIKHARASEIKIELVYETIQMILRIKDNGQGLNTDSLSVVKGFGLMGIKERSDRIGGQLTIQSIPGQGTEITILITN
ncbi:GAF domain-containing sensor histidine kinase [Nostoc parmelioides]|uniref:GAF domain-containing sensor histidine kinase n=1 Tax=Nostoc parmelioides FACHB-3921 TaxID=2692909 RepID=A0ABR8BBY0_9NOSO|nr:GAF domain-containing sensor histidine kinase [Nostoc parmelioides]MBD2251311.1 GAF domain-containing sensor histidine kinase [Nostoc parmelioides FACHB-3921]